MGAETMLLESEILSWGPLVLKADPTPALRPTPPVNIQDWPEKMEGDLVWGPTDFASEDDFIMTLNDSEISEVESALKHFDGLKLPGSAVTRENFPLRTLGPKLEKAAVDLHHGKGFFAVRGLSPCEYTAEENAIVFQGIASYVAAKKGRQNNKGELLVHIRDAKLNKTPQDERPTRYSKRASTFHSDTFCDILALQTRKNAVIGGSNFLASSWTIYNKLQERHPDLVHLLAQPNWGFDSRGEFLPSSSRPILHYHDGRVIINFAREPLLGVKGDSGEDRMVGLPYLTGEQRDALDLLEDIAKESQIKLKAEPGDILFVNNHGILHSREAFEDTPESPRYLVRMWLKNEDLAWKLPESLANNNSRIYGNNELGTSWNFNEEMKSGEFPITERLTS